MGRDSLRWAILRGRGKTGATLSGSAGHDTLKEIGGAVSDRGRRRLGRTGVRRLAWASTSLKVAAQTRDVIFISVWKFSCWAPVARHRYQTYFCFICMCVCSSWKILLRTSSIS
jgi:hypothetical protein